MCRVLQVSRSGYYAWRNRSQSTRRQQDQRLLMHIRALYRKHKRRYGSPRIHRALRYQGIRCGRKRVERLMRQDRLQAKGRRKFRVTTTSRHRHPVAANVLNRKFAASQVNTVWAGDVSYIATQQGWLYLAVVLDLYSRKVVGWSLKATLSQELVLDALNMAMRRRCPAPGLLHHSDQGSQYAAGPYRRVLNRKGVVCSMSRKGNCWDNAVVESFFKTLKVELGSTFSSRESALHAIRDYMVYYNHERLHSTLGYLSPVAYERRQLVA